jgi:molybdenum cofactor guanylyltransferase
VILQDDIYGLVLAGGKSSRMQTDKAALQYHSNISQQSFLYTLLEKYCAKTFISCRQNQADQLQKGELFIVDENKYEGPLNGMLSAHHSFPQKAWIVIAVDLPHISDTTIEQLLNQRDPLKMATAYATRASEIPEPLIAIWEPAALSAAEKYIQEGNRCPRKFLSGQAIKTIFPENDMELFNANYYADYLAAKNRMAAT